VPNPIAPALPQYNVFSAAKIHNMNTVPYAIVQALPSCNVFRCCKMHDWCYTTSNCMGLDYDLPYFVPFKWKCNGGAPYCSEFKL